MEWFKKNKWKVIIPVLLVLVLAGAFWYGGGALGPRDWDTEPADAAAGEPSETPDLTSDASPAGFEEPQVEAMGPEPAKSEATDSASSVSPDTGDAGPDSQPSGDSERRPDEPEAGTPAGEGTEPVSPSSTEAGDAEYSISQGMEIDPVTGTDPYQTEPVPEGKPLPVEPQDAEISDTAYTCTLSISCATILDHMDWLDPEKAELVPEDGWILEPIQVTFYEGESVFNVLQRTCKQQKIHMEFSNTPIYNSAYIEGIHNLYEKDCGELSGWMYKVNEWFPNYGCSRYQLQDGDTICWVYTCDLGEDIGGSFSVND